MSGENGSVPVIKFRVGIVWAGRRHEPVNRTRDMPIGSLLTLANLDIEIISLQKEIPEGTGKYFELPVPVSLSG